MSSSVLVKIKHHCIFTLQETEIHLCIIKIARCDKIKVQYFFMCACVFFFLQDNIQFKETSIQQ